MIYITFVTSDGTVFPESYSAESFCSTSTAVTAEITIGDKDNVAAGLHRWEEAGVIEKIDSLP